MVESPEKKISRLCIQNWIDGEVFDDWKQRGGYDRLGRGLSRKGRPFLLLDPRGKLQFKPGSLADNTGAAYLPAQSLRHEIVDNVQTEAASPGAPPCRKEGIEDSFQIISVDSLPSIAVDNQNIFTFLNITGIINQ